ncbi:hypothetical protein FTV88_1935 [Heliorestis convoluta]|uniref:Uncharacterized protein n=1 Tax=Heliorestis convoluta TaxID=356322 RepID=A0A5Q2N2E4_9FIRM|nr:hypothetical protein FTV88_1935 [Heliorestis convoluta]
MVPEWIGAGLHLAMLRPIIVEGIFLPSLVLLMLVKSLREELLNSHRHGYNVEKRVKQLKSTFIFTITNDFRND